MATTKNPESNVRRPISSIVRIHKGKKLFLWCSCGERLRGTRSLASNFSLDGLLLYATKSSFRSGRIYQKSHLLQYLRDNEYNESIEAFLTKSAYRRGKHLQQNKI